LHGEDTLAIAEAVQALKNRLGDPSLAALNIAEFDGRTVTLGELRSAADAAPFLASSRLVIVAGLLRRLTGRGGEAEGDDDEAETAPASVKEMREALADYLPRAAPTTALVFVETPALSERNRFVKLAGDSGRGRVEAFKPPEDLARWIVQRARHAGGEFSGQGAQALAEVAGGDMRLLANEIEKLLAYVDRARPVDLTDVEMLTPYAAEVNVFQMVDAMGQRQGRAAVNFLHRLLGQPGQTPLAAFGMVARQFRLLLAAREALADGVPAQAGALARVLSLQPFVAGKLMDQCRRFSLAQLEGILRKLLEMDLAIKSSRIDAGLALETFVVDPLGWAPPAEAAA
jgi:DNA polymerase-3 subunit delta